VNIFLPREERAVALQISIQQEGIISTGDLLHAEMETEKASVLELEDGAMGGRGGVM